jgi:hypothetical protein
MPAFVASMNRCAAVKKGDPRVAEQVDAQVESESQQGHRPDHEAEDEEQTEGDLQHDDGVVEGEGVGLDHVLEEPRSPLPGAFVHRDRDVLPDLVAGSRAHPSRVST